MGQRLWIKQEEKNIWVTTETTPNKYHYSTYQVSAKCDV